MSISDVWLAGAYLIGVLFGAPFVGAVLRIVIRKQDRQAVDEFKQRGLRLGGAVIGGLERFLILTFVLRGEYGAIGLVFAAKGLIRYGEIKDAKDQKVAEYVLIGTMLSMLWAVLVGLALLRFRP